VVLGALHDVTDGWTWPLIVLLTALVPMTWAGRGAARDAVLSDGPPEGARTLVASAGPGAPGGR
jgi:MFS transporter, CP family, cyanate transporter